MDEKLHTTVGKLLDLADFLKEFDTTESVPMFCTLLDAVYGDKAVEMAATITHFVTMVNENEGNFEF